MFSQVDSYINFNGLAPMCVFIINLKFLVMILIVDQLTTVFLTYLGSMAAACCPPSGTPSSLSALMLLVG